MSADAAFMQRAIELATRGIGRTAPNPCVGAVLVLDGQVVAEGWHTACGEPHAEIEALRDARRKGVDPRRCILYVTLEPCNHHGKTPPCTMAIREAGIPEVVIGCLDPNPVAMGGAEFLRSCGVVVREGILEQACLDLTADFRTWTRDKRPYSIVKLAVTLDGRIATRTGHAAWISGEASRQEVHHLRSWCGAVMVGGETFRSDNPSLTCRLDGYVGPQPLGVVVTSHLPDAPQDYEVLRTRPEQVVFLTTEQESTSSRADRITRLGGAVWGLAVRDDGLDLASGLRRLYQERGCHHLLVEGGGRLSCSLHRQGLLDELRIFQAMKILGDEHGRPAFAGREVLSMNECWTFRLLEQQFFDTDLYLRLRPKE